MAKRPSHDDERQIALWTSKRWPQASISSSVIVVHADVAMGDSIALLLRLKGFLAVLSPDLESTVLMLEHWTPDVLLLDTRLCRASDFALLRHASRNPHLRRILFIALTDVNAHESPREMRRAGFDGLCRRPCPVWRLADILRQALARRPDPH